MYRWNNVIKEIMEECIEEKIDMKNLKLMDGSDE
jgi:hypothetical protein